MEAAEWHVPEGSNIKVDVAVVVLRYVCVVGLTAQQGEYSLLFSVSERDQTVPLRNHDTTWRHIVF
jgi:hypothetical protein